MTKAEAVEGTGRKGRCVDWSLASEALLNLASSLIMNAKVEKNLAAHTTRR